MDTCGSLIPQEAELCPQLPSIVPAPANYSAGSYSHPASRRQGCERKTEATDQELQTVLTSERGLFPFNRREASGGQGLSMAWVDLFVDGVS